MLRYFCKFTDSSILSQYEEGCYERFWERNFKRIKDNPFISQRELAEAIGLSRPSVANIISGLIQKEYVMGKAYVLNEDYPIVCIGAANVDRKFYVHKI